jgi:outer membrane immunogenic protein
MSKIFVAPAIAFLLAAPVFAQESPSADTSFTGPRAELFGGYEHTESHYRGGVGAPVTGKQGQSAAVGGVELGYDVPLGDRFVAGPLASYSINTTRDNCAGGAAQCVDPKMDWSVGGRVGAKLGTQALLYAKGAYVQTQESARQTVAGVGSTDRDWRGGWRAGVGAEYALSPRTYVKAEYDYTQTERFGLGQQGFTNTSLRQDRQAVVAGFGMRF